MVLFEIMVDVVMLGVTSFTDIPYSVPEMILSEIGMPDGVFSAYIPEPAPPEMVLPCIEVPDAVLVTYIPEPELPEMVLPEMVAETLEDLLPAR